MFQIKLIIWISVFFICEQTSRLNDINAETTTDCLTWGRIQTWTNEHCKIAPACMVQTLSWRESANSQTTRAFVREPSGLPKINQNHRCCRDHPFEPQSIWNKENWYLRSAKHCLRGAAESAVSWKTNKQVEKNWLQAEPKWFWQRQLHFSKFCVCVESPVDSWREFVRARPRHM